MWWRRRPCPRRSRPDRGPPLYAQSVIDRAQAQLEQALAAAFPKGLTRYPVATCAAMTARLAGAWDPAKRVPTRRLTPEEDAFVAGERLLGKIDFRYWAERYVFINAGGTGLQRLYPLWETQEIFLRECARIQEQRVATGHPDGVLINALKARQGGLSTLGAALNTHRATTQGHVRTLLASDVPDNSGSEGLFGMYERIVANLPWWLAPAEKFHAKNAHIIFHSGSAILVESGKSMKGGLQDKGGQKGQLGRSKTFSSVHLTELSTWEAPEQIDDSLMPAVPRSPRTLGIKESTAKGRHNWHHEDWLLGQRGRGRWTNVFIPWYAEETKYWLPAPVDWIPSEDTLLEARKAAQAGPIYLHREVTLSRNQLYWWEETREAYASKGALAKFLEEYASDPESCFQASGRSIFTLDQLQYLRRLARPMIDCWRVDPAKDLKPLHEAERAQAEARRQEAARAEAARRERLRVPPVEEVGVDG